MIQSVHINYLLATNLPVQSEGDRHTDLHSLTPMSTLPHSPCSFTYRRKQISILKLSLQPHSVAAFWVVDLHKCIQQAQQYFRLGLPQIGATMASNTKYRAASINRGAIAWLPKPRFIKATLPGLPAEVFDHPVLIFGIPEPGQVDVFLVSRTPPTYPRCR